MGFLRFFVQKSQNKNRVHNHNIEIVVDATECCMKFFIVNDMKTITSCAIKTSIQDKFHATNFTFLIKYSGIL